MDDQLLQLAFSVYHKPRVYALLLGSGVSASSGIPSGWAVMEHLIRQIAEVKNEPIEGEPYDWYIDQYGEPPSYDRLLAKLEAKSLDRSTLLRPYFEPTPEEREQGLKLPTKAHRSIAKLVRAGYIQIILTTNFDRLLEKALEDEGITPLVISTKDMIEGVSPLQHSQITIVKLHGDYLDSRIKNTPEELAEYDESVNRLLDKVLDEWGLIVCGWSAEWDEALRNAIFRTHGQRYTTYWAAYGELKEDAQRLVDHRQAEVIEITGADDFFDQLEQAVTALQTSNQRHPLSVQVAVEWVKRLLPNLQAQIEIE